MDLSENRLQHPNLITSAQAHQCIINAQVHQQSLIIPSHQAIKPVAVTAVTDLTESLMAELCDYQPEVVLLATGADIVFPATDILQPLVQQNIGLEVLHNQAAARTFNVLLSESRQAVCLMLIEGER
ncbi:Mth938-like domain-containing protein [Marinicella meishanensis]|uniref:Mth938-like domain-containing protein n=1 Tax=Marinicella meishanensis TaxID=2873263 RepID=UPI001CBD57E8|nr:MTH938/NDUFAF3 family protein [Marinicella sp. NBU2979]